MDGLECQPNLDLERTGLLVSGVIEDSPADQAGIKPGDLITHFAGQKVNARIPEDIPLFNQIAYGIGIGKKIQIKGIREGKVHKWSLKTAPRESAFSKEKELKSWGLTVRNFHPHVIPRSSERKQKGSPGPFSWPGRSLLQCQAGPAPRGCNHPGK
jgi:membrane-associated protease RseP (regulator of RpoE activity)